MDVRRNRRVSRRSIVVSAVLLAAIAGGLALHRVAAEQRSLQDDTFSARAGQRLRPDADSPLFYRSVSLPFGDARTNFVLRFRPHSRFRFDFDIQNRGRSPLRIEGLVPPSADSVQMVRFTRLLMQHKLADLQLRRCHGGAADDRARRIRASWSRSSRRVGHAGRITRRGPVEETDVIHLRYSYRGVERTEWFSMPVVARNGLREPEDVGRQGNCG